MFTADPDTVQCGDPVSDCIITFDNSTDGTRYTESNNPKGSLYNDTVLCPSDIVFNTSFRAPSGPSLFAQLEEFVFLKRGTCYNVSMSAFSIDDKDKNRLIREKFHWGALTPITLINLTAALLV